MALRRTGGGRTGGTRQRPAPAAPSTAVHPAAVAQSAFGNRAVEAMLTGAGQPGPVGGPGATGPDGGFEAAKRDALRNPDPRPAEQLVPGDERQQRDAVPEVDVVALWRTPQVRDALREQAERLNAWQRKQPRGGDPKKDTAHYEDEFRLEFMNSMIYILQHRQIVRYKGVAVAVRTKHLRELRDAEDALLSNAPEPPAEIGALGRVQQASRTAAQVRQLRREANERWQRDIDRATARFLVLARNKTDFLTVAQPGTVPVRIYGLPEHVEGASEPERTWFDMLLQPFRKAEPPLNAPSVLRLIDELRRRYPRTLHAYNYEGHEKHSPYVGNVNEVGKYAVDMEIGVPVVDGFYDRAEAVAFFLTLDEAAKATDNAWVAFYNDFEVARQVNEKLRMRRVAFSGAGTPRDPQPGQEGSIHHGPSPYILHIHVNVMPQMLAAQYFASWGIDSLPYLDLGGGPQ
jgi:hypothetical protein